MASLKCLNCISYRSKRKNNRHNSNSRHMICSSLGSVDGTQPALTTNNIETSRTGSTKETLSLSTVSQLNNSHTFLDARSFSLAHDDLDDSKVNLLLSESCSVVTKQSNEAAAENMDILTRLENVVNRLETFISNGSGDSDILGVTVFKNIMCDNLAAYISISEQIGGLAFEQASLIKDAFSLTHNIMKIAQNYSKPQPSDLIQLMKPLSFKLYEISELANRNRKNDLSRQLMMISDSVSILAWVSMPCSTSFVRDIENATQSSANMAIQSCRSTNSLYVDWIRAWLRCVTALRDLVVNLYPVGLIWQPPGCPIPPPSSYISVPTVIRTTDLCESSPSTKSSSSKKQWKRKVSGTDFCYDNLLNAITKSSGLSNLKHVHGFSYQD